MLFQQKSVELEANEKEEQEKKESEENKFNFMEMNEVQMKQHLADLQTANQKSIEKHLQVKT